MSSDVLRKETDAFLSFFSAFELARSVSTIVDLSDGAVLLQVLTFVYVFRLELMQSNKPRALVTPSTSDSQIDRHPNYRTTGLSGSVHSNGYTDC